MTIVILEALMQVGVLLPFMILFMKDRSKKDFMRIGIFCFVFVLYSCALMLVQISESFRIINGSWNWSGKVYGIIWGVVCYFAFRSYFKEHNFFTLKQSPGSQKGVWLATVGITLLAVVAWWFAGSGGEWNIETLAFQLTMPGIDEEIMFRGVLMGLLLSSLRMKVRYLGNPSNLIIAVLFGFVHAFTLSEEYIVSFDTVYFIQTAFAGYIYGWIAIKSRSVLFPILAHNGSNFFGTLTMMIK
ncbi:MULTISPECIES: CPBP family intramembrane glutamic endopeptidase [Myroides]|uniref:Protein severase n=1 Tax=Myroides odoratimimus TaxID=76832 RepID=A0A0U3GCJ6_9FLAO|nr:MULTISPECIES: CPBP family intramembrane glutamic endopeptidase [Myroides]AJA70591.1 CAAX protease self-immunity [Myroides sp. A21]ALU27877.1 protein severase [Myroides odoratimimus]MCS7474426.1 CPBP family intramembrane metalloprotease [Myroides odoratimimus]MDM1086527.1 CPBP family intramembrane metalloprotease [Myroides odoratimimus]MDM1514459.1 CPBP family intramembrane metalloprotease [Myroides odoratimimus]